MASSLNADNGVVSGSSGLKSAADATGVLELQTNGTAALSISTAQVVSTTNGATIQGLTVGKGTGAVSTNVAFGTSALQGSNSGNGNNIAIGYEAGRNNTTGAYNTWVGGLDYSGGLAVGRNNTTGQYNSGFGAGALANNTTASSNTAVGYQAAYGSTGNANVAVGSTYGGYNAPLYANTGDYNVGIGAGSLSATTTGGGNVGVGISSLRSNTTGTLNVAIGYLALNANTTATSNTAVGYQSMYITTTGGTNTAFGYQAGFSIGTGSNNVCIGRADVSAGSNTHELHIATNGGGGKGSSTGYINPNGGGVYQGNNSATWSVTSDQRLKKNIVDNTVGLDAINSIRVRNFEYRLPEEVTELASSNAIRKEGVQLGVIAQELQAVLPDCVKTESTGVMSVDSDNLTWYMINAIKELKAEFDAYKLTHP
jgi:hypothetical protein